MTALFIDGIELSQKLAAELLALADVAADVSDNDALTAIHLVLHRHQSGLTGCVADLAFTYGMYPAETAAHIDRCRPIAARLIGGA